MFGGTISFLALRQISVKLLRRGTTQEGELFQEMRELKISPETSADSCTFFVWPLDIVHVIDKDSPFFDLNATELSRQRFEVVVVMEGTSETSNMTFQARTSYLPHEIQWGQRFEQMLIYRRDQNKFQVLTMTNPCNGRTTQKPRGDDNKPFLTTFRLSVMCLFPQVNFS